MQKNKKGVRKKTEMQVNRKKAIKKGRNNGSLFELTSNSTMVRGHTDCVNPCPFCQSCMCDDQFENKASIQALVRTTLTFAVFRKKINKRRECTYCFSLKRGRRVLASILKLMPIIIVVAVMGLQVTDVTTDGILAQKICSADNCNCIYGLNGMGVYGCRSPWDICSAGEFNGTTAKQHCAAASDNGTTCNKMETWEIPSTCRCEWYEGQWEGCWATGHDCGHMWLGNTSGMDYCEHRNHNDCEKAQAWNISKYYENQRYPVTCRVSIAFIIGPSILSNIFLLIRLLKNNNYKKHLKTAGFANFVEIEYIKIIITCFALIQILPYLCMVLKILTLIRIYRKQIEENQDSKSINTLTVQTVLVFALLEDLPQLYLQMRFYMFSVHGQSHGLIDPSSILVILSILTSMLSLSRIHTQHVIGQNGGIMSALVTFPISFLAIGARVMICGLIGYLISITDHGNVIRLALFLVVCTPFFIKCCCKLFCKCCRWLIAYRKNFCGQYKVPPKPVLVNRSEIETPSEDKADPRVYQNTAPSKPRFNEAIPEVNLYSTRGSGLGQSSTNLLDNSDTSSSEKRLDQAAPSMIPNTVPADQNMYHTLFNLAGKAVEAVQNLIFIIFCDGQSVDGIWSGAIFTLWALVIKMYYLYMPFLRNNYIGNATATTALTVGMLSFTTNSLIVINNGKHRVQCLLITMIFILYPTYSYNHSLDKKTVDVVILKMNECLQGGKLWSTENLIIGDITGTTKIIVTIPGILIMINITTSILSMLKPKSTSPPDDTLLTNQFDPLSNC